MIKSDLASELTAIKPKNIDETITRSDITVDDDLKRKIGKPKGRYVTIESKVALTGDRRYYSRLSECLAKALNDVAGCAKRIMTVGLGNRLLTADALGCLVCERLAIENENGVVIMRSVCPGVYGVTGIESYDIVKGVVNEIRPDLVIAVDSLCAARMGRIGTAFQLTDAGIIPGSGVKNSRNELSEKTLGVKVVSLGVPMVVYASAIMAESRGKIFKKAEDMVVTPKDVDVIVKDCAEIIASAINLYATKKHGLFL